MSYLKDVRNKECWVCYSCARQVRRPLDPESMVTLLGAMLYVPMLLAGGACGIQCVTMERGTGRVISSENVSAALTTVAILIMVVAVSLLAGRRPFYAMAALRKQLGRWRQWGSRFFRSGTLILQGKGEYLIDVET
ncbi:MAG: hypothetical protein U0840_02720 [Gemmataceae bacterium]